MPDQTQLSSLVCTALAAGWLSFLVVVAINAFQGNSSTDDEDRISGDW